LAVAAPVMGAEPQSLQQLPEVSLERMDPAVARQLREAAEVVAGLAARQGAAAELARAYGGLGQLYLAYELYEPAEAALGNAQALAPDDPRWPYLGAVALQELRRLDEAVPLLERVLALRPGDAAAALRLGNAELERGHAERARSLFEQALGNEGTRAAAELGLGRLAAAARSWREAARHFEAALAMQPQASAVRNPLAVAYRELGELERARETLRGSGRATVLFADPLLDEAKRQATGPGVHVLRSLEAGARGDAARALAEARRAVELDPGNDQLHQGLAAALERQGDAAGALAEYRDAVRLAPGSALARLNLGLALARRGEGEAAVAELRRAVAAAPDFQAARLALGTVLLQAGRPEEALPDLQRARELDPADRAARLRLARALRQLGRNDEAEAELASLLAAGGRDAAALLELGTLRAARGDAESALAAWRETAALPGEPAAAVMAHLQSAQLLAGRGDTTAAIAELRAAVERDPSSKLAQFNLATLLAQQGTYDEAARGYARVLELDPADREAYLGRAQALAEAGRLNDARAALEEGLRRLPGDPALTDALARLPD
jgi:tetratricopeptide (TPR) repeat protein